MATLGPIVATSVQENHYPIKVVILLFPFLIVYTDQNFESLMTRYYNCECRGFLQTQNDERFSSLLDHFTCKKLILPTFQLVLCLSINIGKIKFLIKQSCLCNVLVSCQHYLDTGDPSYYSRIWWFPGSTQLFNAEKLSGAWERGAKMTMNTATPQYLFSGHCLFC